MERIKLHKDVYLYRGLLDNTDEMIKFFEENNEWKKWFIFGKISDISHKCHKFEKFPSIDEWNKEVVLSGKNGIFQNNRKISDFDAKVVEAFYLSTADFVEQTGTVLDNWIVNTPSVCVYDTNAGANKEIAMHYHTDYQQEKADAPGEKFGITCTMYLNDNYEGGEIAFKIFDDPKNKLYFTQIIHKPMAGDILVFPSGEPYFHAVKLTTSNQKYFIRSFWQYWFPGTEEWLANEELYGKEVWADMEKQRQAIERNTGKFQRF